MLMPTLGYIRSTKHGMNKVTFMLTESGEMMCCVPPNCEIFRIGLAEARSNAFWEIWRGPLSKGHVLVAKPSAKYPSALFRHSRAGLTPQKLQWLQPMSSSKIYRVSRIER